MSLVTGFAPLGREEELAGAVRLDVVVSRIHAVDSRWIFDLCSPFWRLYRNRAEGAWIEARGQRMALKPGRVYLVPAGFNFRTGVKTASTRLRQDYIHFNFAGYPHGQLRRLFSVPLAIAESAFPAGLLEAWETSMDAGDSALIRRLRASAVIHVAVALAFEGLPAATRAEAARWLERPAELAEPLRMIEERLSDPPGVAELAKACGVGERQLRRRFLEVMGMGPREYGLARRLAAAAEALARGNRPIEEIASDTGFSDRFGFTRSFKAQVGMPPAAYRATHRPAKS